MDKQKKSVGRKIFGWVLTGIILYCLACGVASVIKLNALNFAN